MGVFPPRGNPARRVALALLGFALDAAFYAPPTALAYMVASGAAGPSAEAPAAAPPGQGYAPAPETP